MSESATTTDVVPDIVVSLEKGDDGEYVAGFQVFTVSQSFPAWHSVATTKFGQLVHVALGVSMDFLRLLGPITKQFAHKHVEEFFPRLWSTPGGGRYTRFRVQVSEHDANTKLEEEFPDLEEVIPGMGTRGSGVSNSDDVEMSERKQFSNDLNTLIHQTKLPLPIDQICHPTGSDIPRFAVTSGTEPSKRYAVSQVVGTESHGMTALELAFGRTIDRVINSTLPTEVILQRDVVWDHIRGQTLWEREEGGTLRAAVSNEEWERERGKITVGWMWEMFPKTRGYVVAVDSKSRDTQEGEAETTRVPYGYLDYQKDKAAKRWEVGPVRATSVE